MNPLNDKLASDRRANPDDVFNVKTALNDLDYYNRPNMPLNPYVDRDLFDGIKNFQRDHDLKVDGTMNPGGETERVMRSSMSSRKKRQKSQLESNSIDELRKIKNQGALDYKKTSEKLDFKEKGIGKIRLGLREPIDTIRVRGVKKEPRFKLEMWERTKKRFPTDKIHIDDTADAYRHALSSYIASIRFGERFAKDAGDINERDNLNDSRGARLMDLYNNAMGRELAKNHKNRLRKPEGVIDEALESGLLQTKPFQVKVDK